MTAFIAIMGGLALRLGLCSTDGDDGGKQMFCPELAGCGAAAMLAVATAQVLA